MAANSYTTLDLYNNIQLTGHIPTGNLTFTPQNIITLADRELKTPIVNQILSSRGNYYLTSVTYPASSTGLYDIPPDCIAGALYNIELIQNVTIIQVQPLEESEQFSTNSPTSTTYGYFMVGNQVQILPCPTVGSTKIWYFRRPSQLITTDNACLITAVSADGTQLTVASIPTQIGVLSYIDLVGDQPPFNILGTQTITNITGMIITLDGAPVNTTKETYAALIVNSLVFTAAALGAGGNSITVAYISGGVAGSEVVTVVGNDISVTIAVGVSTASQVQAAFSASSAAGSLVSTSLIASGAVTQTAFAATNLTGGANLTVIPGNYICLNNQTCIPQIPVEFRILLEQRTVCALYEIQGAASKLKPAREKLLEIEKDTLGLISNRVKSKACVIFASDGGFLAGKWPRVANYTTGTNR